MTVIVFLDLIPEAKLEGNIYTALTGIILGVILIAFMDLKFPHQHINLTTEMCPRDLKYFKAGILLCTGIALHNLPEGLAIGAGFIASRNLGIGLAILIALHNLPEGMAVATALSMADLKEYKVLGITALAGLPMGIGAFLGGFFGVISDMLLSSALGFAGGAMLYIVYDELIPDAHEHTREHFGIVGIMVGVISGIILIELLH